MRPTQALTISQIGERLDLNVRQGVTLGPIRHALENPDLSPLDFTGATVRGTIRKTATEYGEPLADLVVVFPVDRTLGYYDFGIPAEITETLPVEPGELSATYYWDSEMVDSLGRVLPFFYGTFVVQAAAARPDVDAPPVVEVCC